MHSSENSLNLPSLLLMYSYSNHSLEYTRRGSKVVLCTAIVILALNLRLSPAYESMSQLKYYRFGSYISSCRMMSYQEFGCMVLFAKRTSGQKSLLRSCDTHDAPQTQSYIVSEINQDLCLLVQYLLSGINDSVYSLCPVLQCYNIY
jgi:hypothetical protein